MAFYYTYFGSIFMFIHNECLHWRITGTKEDVNRKIWQDFNYRSTLNNNFGRHIGGAYAKKLRDDANHCVMPNHLLEIELNNYKRLLEGYPGYDTSQQFDMICMALFEKYIDDIGWPYGRFANLSGSEQPIPIFMVRMFDALKIR